MDLTPIQEGNLNQAANEAGIMRSFVQHPGYKLFVREIEAKLADKKQSWLNASSKEDAEAIRLSNKAWGEILHFAKALIIRGDNAKKILSNTQEPVGMDNPERSL